MKTSGVVVWLFAVVLGSSSARADEVAFGDRGHVALSAERLFGYLHEWTTITTSGGVETSTSGNNFSLLSNATAANYSFPRLAGDLFVARNFSVGLTGALVHVTGSGDGTSDQSGTILQLAPRLGYVVRATPRLAIWPRAGVTYEHAWYSSSSSNNASLTAVTIEAPVAIQLMARTALLIIPYGDVGVAGSRHTDVFGSRDYDYKATEIGVQFGLLVLL